MAELDLDYTGEMPEKDERVYSDALADYEA